MIFADVSNYEEAKRAAELGVDIVAPTCLDIQRLQNILKPRI